MTGLCPVWSAGVGTSGSAELWAGLAGHPTSTLSLRLDLRGVMGPEGDVADQLGTECPREEIHPQGEGYWAETALATMLMES